MSAEVLSAADAAHERRMLKRQLRRAGVEWDRELATAEALREQLRRLGLEPMEVCFGRTVTAVCELEAGHEGPHEGSGWVWS